MASFHTKLESFVQDDIARVIKDIITSSGDEIRAYSRVTPEYNDAIAHRFPNGISKVISWVVEPCNETALRGLMELLAGLKLSFGVKSGGHISIPKIYPPNQGILVSMKQFNEIQYDKENKTLNVGAGVIWKDVYNHLDQYNTGDQKVGVVGGDPDVGVSGWLLGGGYSILTNRFGLGSDNIVAFRVLLPGAQAVCNVSSNVEPELFMALKGGGHNFGIVTQFTLRVHHGAKRTKVKFLAYPNAGIVTNKLVCFIEQERPPEEVMLGAFKHTLEAGKLKSEYLLYDSTVHSAVGPTSSPLSHRVSETGDLIKIFFGGGLEDSDNDEEDHPSMSLAEVYGAFALRHLPVSLEALQTDSQFVHLKTSLKLAEDLMLHPGDLIERKLYELGNGIERNLLTMFTAGNKKVAMQRSPHLRGRMACIMVSTYTRVLIDEAEKTSQGNIVGVNVNRKSSRGISRADSAWPHEEGKVFGPLVGWFEWVGQENDSFWLGVIATALTQLYNVALTEKCTTEDMPIYLNIALENTSVKDIYRDHYNDLKSLRSRYDPNNVMGLAAGFVVE